MSSPLCLENDFSAVALEAGIVNAKCRSNYVFNFANKCACTIEYLYCLLTAPSLGRSLITSQNHLLIVRLFIIIKTILSCSCGSTL
jgi:hypothetical protein